MSFDNCFVTEALFLEIIILNLFLSQLFKKKKQTMKFVRVGELYLNLIPNHDSIIAASSSVVAITNKQ